MKNTVVTALVLMLVIAFPHAALAQSEAGSSELGVSISSQQFENIDADVTVSTTIINVLYGYFVTDALEFAGNLNVIENDLGDAQSTQTGVELQGKYHFLSGPDATFLPYVGLEGGVYGFDDGLEKLTGSSYGLMGGAKFFLSKNASVNLEYNYREMKLEDDSGASYNANITVLGIGYSVYF